MPSYSNRVGRTGIDGAGRRLLDGGAGNTVAARQREDLRRPRQLHFSTGTGVAAHGTGFGRRDCWSTQSPACPNAVSVRTRSLSSVFNEFGDLLACVLAAARAPSDAAGSAAKAATAAAAAGGELGRFCITAY